MALQVQGFSGTVIGEGGTAMRSLKVQPMPVDYGSLGSYRIAMISGTMAAGLVAASEILQMRWSHATNVALIQRVVLDGLIDVTTGFTAGAASIRLFTARAWTADGSGGTAMNFAGNQCKLRTSMAGSTAMTGRIASTAALTAGTKTVDTQPLGQIVAAFPATANVTLIPPNILLGEDIGAQHPVVLAQNEGIVVQATVPATGTWQFGMTVLWTEVTAY